jgi:dipeptidyl aminopeptidase/acylaminoacyl peptidase
MGALGTSSVEVWMLSHPAALIALGSVLAMSTGTALAARPFTVDDMIAMERIADPQPSPDGAWVAYTVTTMDLEANKGRSDIWLAAVDGSATRRMTTHEASDSSPRWGVDGSLYFLSSRSGSSQIWRLPLDGGEARQVTDLALDVDAYRPGPDGALYVALQVFPDCEDPISCTVTRLADEAARASSGRIYDRLFIRHWDTWEDGRRNHVFRVPVDDTGRAGPAVDLMPGVDADCPTMPWGDDGDFEISPDGTWLVYTAKVVNGSEQAWSTNFDLWAVPTDGSAPAHSLTAANPAWDQTPRFSPDGKRLAYLAMERAGFEADRFRVVVMDWESGSRRKVTEGWDRSPDSLQWSADGASLYASAANLGATSIFRIDPTTGVAQVVVDRLTNSSPRPVAGGGLVFARDSLVSPVELYALDSGASEPRPITRLNAERLAGLEFGASEQFSFTGAHGDTVYGYFIKPVAFDPTQRYPLAFLIHGGPQGSFDDHWHYRWNPQIYAAHGYATVMIDFHGSTGYGQAFTDAIRGDWGGAPYQDLMIGLDHILEQHQWIDPSRMAALGASYGGYMINWIQGQTDRFAALVCHDGNLDEYMAYFDTEELWFPEWEHGGTPWENPEGYRMHSPASFLQNWSTPELVIHGALDFRVVDTQGLATFNALQRLGIPSRLLYYPDENHWVLKPQNSIQWHHVVLDWIDRWTTVETD